MKKHYLSITSKLFLLFLFILSLSQQTVFAANNFANPVFSGVPENVTVECDAIPDPATPTATDDCAGDISISLVENILPINNGCANSYNLKRTWTATNDCGEQSVASQTIRVRDRTDPILIGVPEKVTVECDAIPDPAEVTATDNCDDEIEITFSEERIEINNDCPGKYNLKRTWTAVDNCGNQTSSVQVIKVRDRVDPVLVGVPEGVTVECHEIPDPADVTATDNCDANPIIDYLEERLEINNGCDGKYNLRRTWTATDHCGNSAKLVQLIKVRDKTKPEFTTTLENSTVACDAIPDPADVTATDNCDTDVIITMEESIIDINGDCENSYNLRRTWTATDHCGNKRSMSQTLRVRDNTAPVLGPIPANITVACDAIPTTTDVTATDNCDTDVIITTSDVRTDGTCPNSYTLTRTWTATDNCGNNDVQSQIITVIDEVAPILVDAPENITVDCNTIPDPALVTATDNCDATVTVSYAETRFDPADACTNKYNLRRTWTATDACGNETAHTQVIKVRDTEDPVFDAVPEAITVECDQIPSEPTLTATDNCDAPEDITITLVEVVIPIDDACANKYNLKRTWTATDLCGNSTTASQTIKVRDNIDPVLSEIPDNIRVDCDNIPDPIEVTATDNCAGEVAVDLVETIIPITNGCAYSYNLKRTWTATDICGNTASASRTIRVRDTQAPVLSEAPSNVTVACDAIPDAAILTATDNCDTELTVNFSESSTQGIAGSNCSYQITRTWTVSDACGNTDEATQIITVEDAEDPVLSDAPANLTMATCSEMPIAATLTATDNCTSEIIPVFEEVKTNGICADQYTVTRTWTATDACGNSTIKTQVITVGDADKDVLSEAPLDVAVSCDNIPVAAVLIAADNCSNDVEVIATETITNVDCTGNYILTRTWLWTDDCGNTSSKSQTITVTDTQNPVLSAAPADVTVACEAIPTAAVLTATDNCTTDLVPSFTEARTDGNCPDSYALTRTWTVADDCGNAATATQTITVEDTTDPVLSEAPPAITVECSAIPVAATLTATDNCDEDVTITFTEERTDGNCADVYTLTRTWTATDNCGNTAVQTQIITSEGTNNQVLNFPPEDVTVACDAIPTATVLLAEDNCNVTVEVNPSEEITAGDCADSYILTRRWVYTNDCGITNHRTRVITVEDTTDPVLSAAPADATVVCGSVPAAATLTATDNCATDLVPTFSETRTDGDCAGNYILTRTWTVSDNCGNTATKTQIITVEDTTNPTLSALPADATVECDAVPDAPTITATDDCDTELTVLFTESEEEVEPIDDCIFELTRTWTVSDDCGNSTTHTQVITIEDTTSPIIDAPADMTVSCGAIPTEPFVEAMDNCEPLPVEFSETSTASDCNDFYIITRTWKAVDACGNTAEESQVITVEDTESPVLSATPANVTVATCGAVPTAPTLTATDNCSGNITPVFAEVRTNGACNDSYTLTRTWTATDNCGNEAQHTQTITVADNTAPSMASMPADITVNCGEIPAAATLTVTDNCDASVSMDLVEIREDGACGDSYTLTRTWTATDNCGNTNVEKQTITVTDAIDPVLANIPVDVTVACDAIPDAATLTATDNCDSDVTIAFVETSLAGDCPGNYTVTRTWTATDNCGNTDVKSQTITVQDISKPVLSGIPADITVACNAIPAAATPTATDNCDDALRIAFAEVKTDGTCGDSYTLTRTWTVTDNCGNTADSTQVITVEDTSKPVMDSATPADVTVGCNDIPTAATLTATDDCDTDVEVSFNEVKTNGDCVDGYILTRTWTATDNCGNATVSTQVITVEDTTDPVLSGVPTDSIVTCGNIPIAASPTATDICDSAVDISFSEVKTDGACTNSYTLTRTWTATDNCGNTAVATQILTVRDTTNPVLAGIPDNVIVECDAIPDVAIPTVTDDCGNVTIDFNEVMSAMSCDNNYSITRTWTATDECGNTDVQTQVITVDDITNPVLTGVPADVTVTCSTIPLPAEPTVTDNCDTDITIDFTETNTTVDCTNGYVITRTWSARDDCGNLTQASQNINVQDVTIPSLQYCDNEGRNTNFFWIRHVVVGDIDNATTSDGGYADYTNLSTDVNPGSVQTIILSPGYSRYYYYVNWSVWIDYNKDGDFDDENEELFDFRSYNVLKINFDVPTDVVAGETRMRVSMKYGSPSNPCESFAYGETEDYTINLMPSPSLRGSIASGRNNALNVDVTEIGSIQPVKELSLTGEADLKVFPNPVRHNLTVQLSNYQQENAVVRIYNNLGQTVYQTEINQQSAPQFLIDVQDFRDGVYFISIENEKEPPIVQKFYKN